MSTYKLNKGVVDNLESSLSGKSSTDLDNLSQTGEAHFANASLTNTPYTTNRILEIPQDIKLELNNGSITLKAGSKVYVPNGFKSDGTTPKFDVVTIKSDLTPAFVVPNDSDFMWLSVQTAPTFNCNERTGFSSGLAVNRPSTGIYYATDTNVFYFNNIIHKMSFPFGIVTGGGNTSTVVSIDQVFNGFGYIGSTVFALPGVKVQIPNGRNEDGAYINYIEEITSVKTNTFTSESGSVDLFYNSDIKSLGAAYTGTYIYDSSTNSYVNKVTRLNITSLINVANCSCTSGKISSFKFADVDSVANSNASNFSQAGRSYLSGLGMPSSRYIVLTLGASGSTYTAPANGYFGIAKTATAAGQVLQIEGNCNGFETWSQGAYRYSLTVPVLKGNSVKVYYSMPTTGHFVFIYAAGEE